LEEEMLEDEPPVSPSPTATPPSSATSIPATPEEDKKKYFKSYG
jgi:hypothetical protein